MNTSDGLLVKKIKQRNKKIYLQSINDLYNDIEIDEIKIVGKVTGVLTKV
ncbi:S24 family peptidase [Sulfurimonas sp.]